MGEGGERRAQKKNKIEEQEGEREEKKVEDNFSRQMRAGSQCKVQYIV